MSPDLAWLGARRISARVFLAAAALLGGGACSSASVRAVVQNRDGKPIPEAILTLAAAPGGVIVQRASADASGCVGVPRFVDRREDLVALRVEAPGYQPIDRTLHRPQREPLLVTLAATSDAAPSDLRPISPADQSIAYDLACAPVVPPGATSIGID